MTAIPQQAPPEPLPAWRLLLRDASTAGVPARSLRVALVVGTALNLINQGDAIFGAGAIHWVKLLLTYAMPYAVSTYGAIAFRRSLRRKESDGD
jgi:hypothetical protein